MRLGVLDVGSNTVHLVVVDASRGERLRHRSSQKTVLRLAEQIGTDGEFTADGAGALVAAVGEARDHAERLRVDELIGVATSAVREARNGAEVLERVRRETGVALDVLSGTEEARLTFLAVRRWFGWSAGRLLVLDIGGGSLEVGYGADESPQLAVSLPLGAGRLTRERLDGDPPPADQVAALTEYVDKTLEVVPTFGEVDRVAATSKTFKTLARLAGRGSTPSGTLTGQGLRHVLQLVRRTPSARLAEREGVSARRAHQLLAGAVVAETAMRKWGLSEVEICPWALREGVIFRRLDEARP